MTIMLTIVIDEWIKDGLSESSAKMMKELVTAHRDGRLESVTRRELLQALQAIAGNFDIKKALKRFCEKRIRKSNLLAQMSRHGISEKKAHLVSSLITSRRLGQIERDSFWNIMARELGQDLPVFFRACVNADDEAAAVNAPHA